MENPKKYSSDSYTDPHILVSDAQRLATMFNEKMQSLNASDRLFFLDNFNKSINLSPQLLNQAENGIAEKDANNSSNILKMKDGNINKVAQDFELLSLDDSSKLNGELRISSSEKSFSDSNAHTLEAECIDKKIATNTDEKASEFSTSQNSVTTKKDKKTRGKNIQKQKVDGNDLLKQHSTINKSDELHASKTAQVIYSTKDVGIQKNNDCKKFDQPQKISSAMTTDTPKFQKDEVSPWRENPIQSHVANVSQYTNEWIKNRTPQQQQSRQSKLEKSNKKSLNILILGESGVGKSTWINAFANYLIYNTLEDAIAAESPVCVIPTQFTLFDGNNEQHEVILGNQDNEIFSQGDSTTQDAKTYLFENDKYDIYLIDTPGMNDTRGKEQDDKNIQSILRAIAPFKELHAICFLFKPKENRLKSSFTYTLSTLLNNLSRSSLNNICIIFTHASGTFYRPGETLGLLETHFKELKEKNGITVKISDDNVFCLDNEAFRFCCAYFGRVKFDKSEFEDYSESWQRSKDEISRLLKYAARLRPQSTADVLSINETRTWILQLVSPAIKVGDIIQTNLQNLDKRIHELESIKNNIEELQKRSAVPLTSLKIIQLEHPQTVCASQKCVKYEKVMNNLEPIYTQVCHKNCYIPNGDSSKIPDPALIKCLAFNYAVICNKCNCSINDHIRIFYEQKIETNYVETYRLKNALASTKNASELKGKMIESYVQIIKEYNLELNFIMTAMSKFYFFLSTNGVDQKADIFEKHILSLMNNEKRMFESTKNYDDQKYNRLADFLNHYRRVRIGVLKEDQKLSLIDIQGIRQKLFAMPHMGPKIAEIFDIHVEVDENDYAENITRCDKNTVIAKSTSWFQTVKKLFSLW